MGKPDWDAEGARWAKQIEAIDPDLDPPHTRLLAGTAAAGPPARFTALPIGERHRRARRGGEPTGRGRWQRQVTTQVDATVELDRECGACAACESGGQVRTRRMNRHIPESIVAVTLDLASTLAAWCESSRGQDREAHEAAVLHHVRGVLGNLPAAELLEATPGLVRQARWRKAACSGCEQSTVPAGWRERTVATRCGTVTVPTIWYHRARCRSGWSRPKDSSGDNRLIRGRFHKESDCLRV